MVTLRRTVRFSLPPPGSPFDPASPRRNAYAGWPSAVGIGVWGEIDVVVRGEPDRHTGYLINITELDRAVRDSALPFLHAEFGRQAREAVAVEPVSTLPELFRRVGAHLAERALPDRPVSLTRLGWRVTPFHAVAIEPRPATPPMSTSVELLQRFEFSASHRLHCPEYDAATNERIFGKCNNPNGHGHNYQVEVRVETSLSNAPQVRLADIERIVDDTVIRRFDHKHLNSDCPEFASLNPSVEHIAKVCFDLLAEPFRVRGATLRGVTVWETEKTACTYPAC